jgi:hypothetical protein
VLRRLDLRRPRAAVGLGVVIGVVAGLAAAVFATLAAEPSIETAIAIEEAHRPPTDHGEPLVRRSDQRGIGLFAGYALTGGGFGLLFGGAFALGSRRSSDWFRLALAVGSALAGALTVLPWLKYPPNPPAVGDPSTLAHRQGLYGGLVVVSAVLLLAAVYGWRRMRRSGWTEHGAVAALAGSIAAGALVVLAVFPPAPDPVELPAGLVWSFRLASLGANLLLWAVLTLGFGLVAAAARARRFVG